MLKMRVAVLVMEFPAASVAVNNMLIGNGAVAEANAVSLSLEMGASQTPAGSTSASPEYVVHPGHCRLYVTDASGTGSVTSKARKGRLCGFWDSSSVAVGTRPIGPRRRVADLNTELVFVKSSFVGLAYWNDGGMIGLPFVVWSVMPTSEKYDGIE